MSNIVEGSGERNKQALFLTVGKVVALILTFFMPVFLARFLSREEYGIYAQFYAVSVFVVAIFSFGMHNNLYYFYPRNGADKKRAVIGNTLIGLLISALVGCFFTWLPLTGKYILGEQLEQDYLGYLLIYMVVAVLLEMMEPFYVVLKDFKASIYYPILHIVFKTVFVVLFAVTIGGLKSVILGLTVGEVVLLMVALYYYWYKTKVPAKTAYWDKDIFVAQLKYTLPFGGSVVLFTMANQFDKIISMKLLSPEIYAVYSVSFYAIPGIVQLYSSVGNVYLVDITKSFHNNDTNSALQLFKDLSTKMYSFTLPAILGVCVYANAFITIVFSEKYVDAIPLFRIHIFAFIFTMFGAGLIIRGSGKTKYSLWAYGISSMLALPMIYFAIKHYGVLGGVISATIGQVLPRVIQMYYELRLLKISLKNYCHWKKLSLITLISVGVAVPFLLQQLFYPCSKVVAVLLGGLYITTVFALEIRCNLFIYDIKSLKSKFAKVLKFCK